MQIHSVGIDLGKTIFHLVALGTAGKVLAHTHPDRDTQKAHRFGAKNLQLRSEPKSDLRRFA